ncbi:MAG TPA: glutathionylspermidine synthase family protein [Kofleriaceae bacterium]
MNRRTHDPRPDWRARVEAQGLVFHTAAQTGVYWGEDAYYEFTAADVDAIEDATRELHALCVAAVGRVIADRRYAELGLDALAIELVERSWFARAPSLYGRLDLAFGPDGVPKLLEYNADTPTSLLEAAVVQWTWCDECMPHADQASALHDELIGRWRELARTTGPVVHFASVDDVEDEMTCGYLRDTAQQAGLETVGLKMGSIGWDPARRALVDLQGRPIRSLFKLYPWEGLVLDDLAPALAEVDVTWLEPAWKMVLSNKAILPILWELFPDHPNLLPASREPGRVGEAWVKKPLFGREGSNVTVVAPGVEVATEGPYDDRGWVYQAYADLGEHAAMRPVIGSWLVGDRPAGIGIRETAGYVTNNTARFVPHVVRS